MVCKTGYKQSDGKCIKMHAEDNKKALDTCKKFLSPICTIIGKNGKPIVLKRVSIPYYTFYVTPTLSNNSTYDNAQNFCPLYTHIPDCGLLRKFFNENINLDEFNGWYWTTGKLSDNIVLIYYSETGKLSIGKKSDKYSVLCIYE